MIYGFNTLVDVLRIRAEQQPKKTAFVFLQNGEKVTDSRNFFALDKNAKGIACLLLNKIEISDNNQHRILLLFPSCLEYIDAFFGVLYAGQIAVSAYPPSAITTDIRLTSIINDVKPQIILTHSSILKKKDLYCSLTPALQSAFWYAVDMIPVQNDSSSIYPGISPSTLAFIQYTSGSVSEPKGVMVTHANFIHNEQMVCNAFSHDSNSTFVSWLPFYHDMGLIGNILQPLFIGASCYLMSPLSFLKKPCRWLYAIAGYRAHTTGAPNFAYELCTAKIKDSEMDGVDLSCWQIAFNGSEPVRYSTQKNFYKRFKKFGFKKQTFYPCYGMAETTLFVTGGRKSEVPLVVQADRESLALNKFNTAENKENCQSLVSSGRCWLDQEIKIVDTETMSELNETEIGEIWLKSPSNALGYWKNPIKTNEVFHAFTRDGSGPFLRTGDIGFLYQNELFVTGRIKDMIIFHGKNYYPQDIETVVFNLDPCLKPDCCAAFSIDTGDQERLVIVQEIVNRYDPETIESVSRQIYNKVCARFDIEPYRIVFVKSGQIPKTTSGKIQRSLSHKNYLEKSLNVIKEYTFSGDAGKQDLININELEKWFTEKIARKMGLLPHQIDLSRPFTAYGYDSINIMEHLHIFENKLNLNLPIEIFYESRSINDLIKRIREFDYDRIKNQSGVISNFKENIDPAILNDIENMSETEINILLKEHNYEV